LPALGGRAGQIGRQKIPVVFTAVKNKPSKRGSRAAQARRHSSGSSGSDGIALIATV
jgi:hypothetical protein